ncbi:AI-2E family transporter [Neolewinella lacunae]|uniref:AI-2E family transporter n=1 Tax=Neolewinella lacunae TaxID=1517758 RepID=A0A923PJB9_9BACT|nr:AI-2E family transporter [Neolewinella lacunae]MBC6994379.1 AI-2E family transporter [Neolewinella lacunae]MDN3633310.1 AI-2E family transporter [Neolewinella lacunae]
MTNATPSRLPGAVLRLALIVLTITILYFGRALLLPLAVAGVLATLLSPIDDKLRSWGWPSKLAIAGAVSVLLLFFAILFAAIGQQARGFAENWPQTKERVNEQLDELKEKYKIEQFLPGNSGESASGEGESAPSGSGGEASTQAQSGSSPVGSSSILSFIGTTFGVLGDFFLMLIYVILILAQKERIRKFVIRRTPDKSRKATEKTLAESGAVVQKYLHGTLILIGTLAVLYSVGFLIIGLDYAILIALLVATLSLIPYLGNIIGGLFALALAFATGGDGAVLGVLITMTVAQLLENYVLTPLVVGDEVNINPLTTIVCVVGMSIVWGPVGAIIAIPIFAILRVVFQRIPGLEDYAYLMGQED